MVHFLLTPLLPSARTAGGYDQASGYEQQNFGAEEYNYTSPNALIAANNILLANASNNTATNAPPFQTTSTTSTAAMQAIPSSTPTLFPNNNTAIASNQVSAMGATGLQNENQFV